MNAKKYFNPSAQGKGGYIALALCALAIGTAGFLHVRNQNKETLRSDAEAPEESRQVAVIGSMPAATTAPTIPKAEKPTEKEPMKTAAPVEGITVAVYAMDALDYNETTRDWRTHNGVDIAAEAGTGVCAAADGVVYTVYEDEALGMTVVIRHEDGYVTKYSSLDKAVQVVSGESVTMGQTIGYVGDTALLETAEGCHVHFSVTHDGEAMDPGEFCNLG